jgi:hypothetical protein
MTNAAPATHEVPCDLTMRDALAVRSLIERYAFAMDRRDTELMRTCFTPDADLSYLGGLRQFTGDSFSDALVSSMSPFKEIDHAVSSINVTVDGDTAHADMHILATLVMADRPSIIIRGVRVVDDYIRTEDGWKICKRRHMPFSQYEVPSLPIDFPGVGGVDQ